MKVLLFVLMTNAQGETATWEQVVFAEDPAGRCAHWFRRGAEKFVEGFDRFDTVVSTKCEVRNK